MIPCGRVVGINTFINVEAEQAVHINYAEKADPVLEFLRAHQVPATEQAEPCRPGNRPDQAATPAGTPNPSAAQPDAPVAPPGAGSPAH